MPENRRKLCFINYDLSNMGGLNRVSASLANALAADYEVTVLSLYNRKDRVCYPLEPSIQVQTLFSDRDRYRTLLLGNFPALRRFFRDHPMDVILLEGTYTVPYALTLRSIARAPGGGRAKILYHNHVSLSDQYHSPLLTLEHLLGSRLADCTVTLTKRGLGDFQKKFHVAPGRMRCIYNWIDESIWPYTGVYDADSRKILTVGRFETEKGYDLLVDAAEKVFAAHPDWEWHIYGDGVEFSNIQSLVKSRGLEGRLILQGATDRMYEKYKEYAIYVLTSRREGMPLVLLEAKANHLPVVSFNCVTGPDEMVQDGTDGYLIPPFDTGRMAEKICALIDSPDRRSAFSQRSGDNLQQFRQSEILSQWRGLIDAL